MGKIRNTGKEAWKIFSCFLGLTACLLFIMFAMKKVAYGERVGIVKSNEYYWNINQWEITPETEYVQKFAYTGSALHSFSLKYNIQGNSDAKWLVQLLNLSDEKVLQEWEEKSSGIVSGGIQEYVLENSYNNQEQKELAIKVSMPTDEASGIFLCGSEENSLNEGVLLINGQEQEGDLSVTYTQIEYVKITIVYAVLQAMIEAALICFFIFGQGIPRVICWAKKCMYIIGKNRGTIGKFIGMCAISVFLIVGSHVLFIKATHRVVESYLIARWLFWIVVCWSGIVLYFQREYLEKRPEIAVCSILLLIGMLYIAVIPAEMEVSWDESIHFWKSVGVSHATTGLANPLESYLYWHSGIPYGLPNKLENLSAIHNNMQSIYHTGSGVAADTGVLSRIYMVGYIPAAIMLKIGRGLHMPYWMIFKMGTSGNLLMYVTLIYFSMRKLKSGKMILAVSASIGCAFFLSTVYSYDTWVSGWFMLGMATFFGCMQREEKVQNKELFLIVFASTIAFFPKAVYFPLLTVYFLIPQKKFESMEQYQKFLSAIVASILTLMLGVVAGSLWILPIWFVFYVAVKKIISIFKKIGKRKKILALSIGGAVLLVTAVACVYGILPKLLGRGDLRGGEAVNSALQVKFILSNPVKYAKILLVFLKDNYLSFQVSWKNIFNTLGYLGSTKVHVISLIFLIVVCITDKDKNDCWKGYAVTRYFNIAVSFLTVCLIATALYVSFTPVGYETVAGCQQRYLIPMLYAVCGTIGSCKIENKMNKTWYYAGNIAVICSILMSNIWTVVVSQYC